MDKERNLETQIASSGLPTGHGGRGLVVLSDDHLHSGLECRRTRFAGAVRKTRSLMRGPKLGSRVDADFGAALLAFNEEVVVFCQGISDLVAREYAVDYARMLQNRARGVETNQPRIPVGLFEPDRNLIKSALKKLNRKFFPKPKSTSASC
jgi:hypothetical protein